MYEEVGKAAQDYDEDAVLTEYVWRNYSHLITKPEHFTAKTIPRGPEAASQLALRFPESDCDELRFAICNGMEAFRQWVRDRVLRDNQVSIVRCPSCCRIVKTPQARQCLWCGHDWHE